MIFYTLNYKQKSFSLHTHFCQRCNKLSLMHTSYHLIADYLRFSFSLLTIKKETVYLYVSTFILGASKELWYRGIIGSSSAFKKKKSREK